MLRAAGAPPRLAPGIRLAAAGALGGASWRCRTRRAARDAAARSFFADPLCPQGARLEHDPKQWIPVFREDHAQTQAKAKWRFKLIPSRFCRGARLSHVPGARASNTVLPGGVAVYGARILHRAS